MKRHTSVTLVLTTNLLLLNTAIAQEIIKDKPTPSRAEIGAARLLRRTGS